MKRPRREQPQPDPVTTQSAEETPESPAQAEAKPTQPTPNQAEAKVETANQPEAAETTPAPANQADIAKAIDELTKAEGGSPAEVAAELQKLGLKIEPKEKESRERLLKRAAKMVQPDDVL